MKGTIFKGILLILFLGVGETAVYSQQQQRKDTLVVTRDGTGDYRNIQEAVEAVRAFMDYTVTIYIKNGTYKEKLVIPSWVKNVQLVGESAENTGEDPVAAAKRAEKAHISRASLISAFLPPAPRSDAVGRGRRAQRAERGRRCGTLQKFLPMIIANLFPAGKSPQRRGG